MAVPQFRAGEHDYEYSVANELGRGATATVYSGTSRVSSEQVALKVISKSVLIGANSVADLASVQREVEVMSRLAHENVIQLKDAYETDTALVLVLELASGGELFEYLEAAEHFPEEVSHYFFQQLVLGVQYCHERDVCHRDIKLENLLLSKDGLLKISDFGLSQIMPKGTYRRQEQAGTQAFWAPEVFRGGLYNLRGADVWACGVVLYTMLTGAYPYGSDGPFDSKTLTLPKYALSENTLELQELMPRLLDPDPTTRISMEQLLQHPWVAQTPMWKPVSTSPEIPESMPFINTQEPEETGEASRIAAAPLLEHSASSLTALCEASLATTLVGAVVQTPPVEPVILLNTTAESGTPLSGGETSLESGPSSETWPAHCPPTFKSGGVRRPSRFVSRYSIAFLLKRLPESLAELGVDCTANPNSFQIQCTQVPLEFHIQLFQLRGGSKLVQFQRQRGDPLTFQKLYRQVYGKLFGEGLTTARTSFSYHDLTALASVAVSSAVVSSPSRQRRLSSL
jgi:serine/threonine protein kinase